MRPLSFSLSSSCLWFVAVFALLRYSLSAENPSNGLCITSERTVLLQFKNDLVDSSNWLSSWASSNQDCCKWPGITCNNRTGHVTGIQLRGPDDLCLSNREYQEAPVQILGGKLNPSLLNLTRLESLDLSCNDFGGEPIPTFIGSLHNLTYLNLSESGFSGEIPSQLGDLSDLRVLSVSNLFSDEYELSVKSLQWLSGLSELSLLDMSGVQLTEAFDWLQVIENLLPSSLVELHLSFSGLPPVPPHLTVVDLTSLSVLDLSYNNFSTSPIPSWISSLTSLVSLNLANCNFNGPVPAALFAMNSLRTLDLSNNQLIDIQSNSSLSNICNLWEINLSWNEFDGKSLWEVLSSLFECELSKLESFKFASSGLSGSLPKELGNLKNLVHIDLNSNSISGLIPESLGNLSSLQTLELGYNSISGPLPDSVGRLSSLLSLYLPYNTISGPLPDSLGRLSSLEQLDLSHNEINGSLPQSLGQLEKLINLNIEHNLLTGVVTEDHFANLTSLITLRAEANMLTLKPRSNNWVPPFQLERLNLNSWSLGPKFPSWLQNQNNLFILYLSSTGISDIPNWFWTKFSGLQYLNLSNNTFSSVSLKDFLCSKIEEEQKQVIYLNMGNSHLSGVLPDCWTTWEFLNILNFQNNNLSGEIPRSLENLSSLESMNMRGNKLSGELPVSLMNSKSLLIIDLAENQLVGGIPGSIRSESSSLHLLSLRSNKLTGEIPDELCRIDSIQILDLADNNFSGNIPKCFYNFSVMSGKGNLSQIVGLAGDEFMGSAYLVMRGRENAYSSILGLVTLLDLSDNNLSGVIPSEVTRLVGLRSLNLSGNQLTGRIPEKVGEMKLLEYLDLSVNQLDGEIPLSMSGLNFLTWLNLSYNNLTGRIPTGTQLQSLGELSFIGNRLCGVPLTDRCQRQGGAGDVTEEEEEKGDGSDGPDWGLIISIVIGFVVGFWVMVGPLIASKLWRNAYFRFLHEMWWKICDFCRK